MNALAKLSEIDPWFKSGSWQSPAIGALSRDDMVDEFRAVLRSDTAGFAVRSIVLEAAAIGAPLPALKDDLVNTLLRRQAPYAERLYALIALLRIGTEGGAAAEAAFRQLGTDAGALRLRAEMIRRMYGRPFGPADIKALLTHMAASSDETAADALSTLAKHIPLDDIPAVLDGIRPATPAAHESWRIGRATVGVRPDHQPPLSHWLFRHTSQNSR